MKRIDRVMARLAEMGKQDAWLADQLGVSPQNVGNWKVRDLPSSRILDVARALSLRPEYIDIGELPAKAVASRLAAFSIKTDQDPPEDGDITVEVADIELSAGGGTNGPEFIETRFRHTYRAEYLRSEGIQNPSSIRRCRVRGDSMERVLFHGDMATIDTADTKIMDDFVYAIVVADQIKVKRLRKRRDGGLLIISENPLYKTEEVPPEETNSIYIIGRVFDRSGGGGLKGLGFSRG